MNKNKIILYIPHSTDEADTNKLFRIGHSYDECVMQQVDGEPSALIFPISEDAILVDCCTFVSEDSDADICIGHNNDATFDPEVIGIALHEFQKAGYSVSINKPIAGSTAPKCDCHYRSLRIAVSRRVYWNMLHNNPRQWMRWAGCINRIYEQVAECSPMPRFE